jgi:hypothetical protein
MGASSLTDTTPGWTRHIPRLLLPHLVRAEGLARTANPAALMMSCRLRSERALRACPWRLTRWAVFGTADTEHAEQYDLTVGSEEEDEGERRATPVQAVGHKAKARRRRNDDDDDVRSAHPPNLAGLACGAVRRSGCLLPAQRAQRVFVASIPRTQSRLPLGVERLSGGWTVPRARADPHLTSCLCAN